mmetsp:Transcript_75758/g.134101  ORF Transcript_75758/g.134101 Transcript_75758/m.134101 type:complete len:454 (-) Transcript_75758:100-1461(-)
MSRWLWRESGGLGPTDAFLREVEADESQPDIGRTTSIASVASTAFLSVQGDESKYDGFFAMTMCEQIKLKLFKAKFLASDACQDSCGLGTCLRFLFCRRKSSPSVPAPTLESQDANNAPPQAASQSDLQSGLDAQDVPSEFIRRHWLGQTLQKIDSAADRWWSVAHGPSWRVGNAKDLEVRKINYAHEGKGPAEHSLPFGSMYECLSCDAIRSTEKIQEIIGKHVKLCDLPTLSMHQEWSEECPLPRILCLNVMLPYTKGKTDPGCSYVAIFHIKPEVLTELQQDGLNRYNCVRMFAEFCKSLAGAPSVLDHPHRSLQTRRDQQATRRVNFVTGACKATAYVENVSELSLSRFLSGVVGRFNGKPTVITKSGYVVKANPDIGPPGEWMEIGIDVREFNGWALKSLYSYRDSLIPSAAIHFGIMIQAVHDEDLPEGLVCDMHVFGIDISKAHEV